MSGSKKAKNRITTKKVPAIPPEDRHHMIEEAAYYLAKARGFKGSLQLDDWLRAEGNIDRALRKAK